MEPVVKKILVQMTEGKWEQALPKPLYKEIREWFTRHIENSVVVRMVFLSSDKEGKFACHLLCPPGETRVAAEIYMPAQELWEDKPHLVLAVPDNITDYPLFYLPHNTLNRAISKKKRKKL